MSTINATTFELLFSGFNTYETKNQSKNFCFRLEGDIYKTKDRDNWTGMKERHDICEQACRDAEEANGNEVSDTQWNFLVEKYNQADENLTHAMEVFKAAKDFYKQVHDHEWGEKTGPKRLPSPFKTGVDSGLTPTKKAKAS
jgi:hypothetical protein